MFHKDSKIILVSLKEKIMDGWGSLTMLIKRQNAEKYRKADLRYKLQKRKEEYVHDAYDKDGKALDFPEVSQAEMEKIKKEIRREMKAQKIRGFIPYVIAILFIAAFLAVVFISSAILKS